MVESAQRRLNKQKLTKKFISSNVLATGSFNEATILCSRNLQKKSLKKRIYHSRRQDSDASGDACLVDYLVAIDLGSSSYHRPMSSIAA